MEMVNSLSEQTCETGSLGLLMLEALFGRRESCPSDPSEKPRPSATTAFVFFFTLRVAARKRPASSSESFRQRSTLRVLGSSVDEVSDELNTRVPPIQSSAMPSTGPWTGSSGPVIGGGGGGAMDGMGCYQARGPAATGGDFPETFSRSKDRRTGLQSGVS